MNRKLIEIKYKTLTQKEGEAWISAEILLKNKETKKIQFAGETTINPKQHIIGVLALDYEPLKKYLKDFGKELL